MTIAVTPTTFSLPVVVYPFLVKTWDHIDGTTANVLVVTSATDVGNSLGPFPPDFVPHGLIAIPLAAAGTPSAGTSGYDPTTLLRSTVDPSRVNVNLYISTSAASNPFLILVF